MLEEQFLFTHYKWENACDFDNGPSWEDDVMVENPQVVGLKSYPSPHYHPCSSFSPH
jgi:hypothetical protein